MSALLAGASLALLAVVVWRRGSYPFWLAASVSFMGVRSPELGVGLDLSAVGVGLGAVLVVLALSSRTIGRVPARLSRFVVFVAASILLGALLWYGASLGFSEPGLVGARSPVWRSPIQVASRLASLAMVLLAFAAPRRRPGHSQILEGVLLGTTIQCLLALLQVGAYQLGLPFVALPLFTEPAEVGGVLRAAALAGEPRHLAAALLPSIAILLVWQGRAARSGWAGQRGAWLLALHVLTLVLTFSVTGLVLVVPVVLFVATRRPFARRRILGAFGVLGALAALAGGAAFSSHGASWKARALEHLDPDYLGRSEYASAAALEVAREHPSVLVLGVGVGNAPFHLRRTRVWNHRFPSVRVPGGVLLLVLESGLLVALVYLGWAGWLALRAARPHLRGEEWGPVRVAAACGAVATMLVGVVGYGPLSATFMLLVGEAVCAEELGRTR